MQDVYSNHEDMIKNQIMNATIRCIEKKGVDKTRIGDISSELGVARQTIYNYFSNKNELMNATFSRAGLTLAENVRNHVAGIEDLEDKLTEAILYAIQEFPKEPVLGQVLETGGQYLLEFGVSRQTMQAFGEFVLLDVFEEHPFLKKQSEEICEFISRNILSILMMPDDEPRTDKELELFIRRRIIPGLGLNKA